MPATEREITFVTADGYTIFGNLHLPDGATADRPRAAVLLLHGAAHDREAFTSFVYPGMSQILNELGVAALRIDWRGRGESIGQREFHSFSAQERAAIHLDIEGALNFLGEQPEIDELRLAIFAEEISAEFAVQGSEGDQRVKALAFISGRLSPASLKSLQTRPETPVFCVVSKEDRRGIGDMSAAVSAARHPESALKTYDDMGQGTTMFTLWRYKYPDQRGVEFLAKTQGVDTEKIGLFPRDPGDEKPIENVICDWLASRLKGLGCLREISFESEDGWTLFGNLTIPEDLPAGTTAPGVVLLHSGWSDRYSFFDLERLFASSGIAVLNIDWRGRGKSRGKGKYFTLGRDERDRAYLDAKAALNILAEQPEVDEQRLGILGSYLGSKFAVGASLGDPRVKALIMLSGYIPSATERDEIAGAHFAMLFIGSRGFAPVTNAMADLHELTKSRGGELLVFDGGALGYQLLENDEELKHKVVKWTEERLSG